MERRGLTIQRPADLSVDASAVLRRAVERETEELLVWVQRLDDALGRSRELQFRADEVMQLLYLSLRLRQIPGVVDAETSAAMLATRRAVGTGMRDFLAYLRPKENRVPDTTPVVLAGFPDRNELVLRAAELLVHALTAIEAEAKHLGSEADRRGYEQLRAEWTQQWSNYQRWRAELANRRAVSEPARLLTP
jgi:hypothetical protein